MDYLQELEDEFNGQYGDPRRCPVHGCTTSSPDGLCDAPGPACEGESDEIEARYENAIHNRKLGWEGRKKQRLADAEASRLFKEEQASFETPF